MTCRHCGTAVPAEAERCPQCLRKSGLLEPEPPPQQRRAGGRPSLLRIGGLLVFAVALVGARAALMSRPRPNISLPPSVNLDPLDLDQVRVQSSTTAEKNDLHTVNLTADGGDFERTFQKLRVHAIATTVQEVKSDISASGAIRVFIPPRFRTPAHEARVEEEEKTIRSALVKTSASTPKGAAIRVAFEFGEMPK